LYFLKFVTYCINSSTKTLDFMEINCSILNNTVGWVIWIVKIVPDMTYNVFDGTLNATLLLPQQLLLNKK